MNLFRILICSLTQLKQSIDGTVKMADHQVEHFRQEKNKVQKALSKAEARIRKLEEPQTKKVLQIESETLYEQELDRNKVHNYLHVISMSFY